MSRGTILETQLGCLPRQVFAYMLTPIEAMQRLSTRLGRPALLANGAT